MSFEPLEYLRHIVAEADYLAEQTASISKHDFLKNETGLGRLGPTTSPPLATASPSAPAPTP